MPTLDERVTTLEELIPTLATKEDMREMESRMNTRMDGMASEITLLKNAVNDIEGNVTKLVNHFNL